MKFDCGTKGVWLPMVLAAAVMLAVPLFFWWIGPIGPPPGDRDEPPAPVQSSTPPPPAPNRPSPVSTNSADPVMRGWQNAIRTRDAKGVMNAQSAFLDREGEYREKLVEMAKGDSDPRIRAFSVAVLGRMKSPPPESYFVERLDDASEYPRTSALEALEKVGTGACLSKVDGLASSDPVPSVRAAAAKAAKAVRSR